MRCRKKIFKIVGLPLLMMIISSCTVNKETDDDVIIIPEDNYFRVEFQNHDSSFLYSNYLIEGSYTLSEIYNGQTPTRPEDEIYEYTFSGWEKDNEKLTVNSVINVNSDVTLKAFYSKKEIVYYTVQFVNYDGEKLYEVKVRDGGAATYEGDIPTRPDDDKGNTYTFVGWSGDTSHITDDTIFVANYSSKKRKQTVRFLNYDETVLDIQSVFYGDTVTYTGETPTRPDEGAYKYTFSGWDKSLVNIIEDTDIHAEYSSDTRTLIVSFVNYDGSLLYSTEVEYGGNAVYGGPLPTRPSEGRNAFSFYGWSGSLENITGNVELRALYEKVDREASAGLRFSYDLMNESYTVTGYDENESEVFVPKTFNDGVNGVHPVTRIGQAAFSYKNFTSIFLEDNVQFIDDSAFEYCYNLSSFRAPSLLRSLGQYVFRSCNKIGTINFPSTLDSIDKYTFCDFNNYKTSVKISSKNPYYSVEDGILYNRDQSILYFPLNNSDFYSTTSLTVKDGVKEISNDAFIECDNLSMVILPDSLEKIGKRAFYGCDKLSKINFPDNLETIDEYALAYCGVLGEELVFPSKLKLISQSAFFYDRGIKKITFDNSPCSISIYAFQDCSMSTIEFGNSIKRIDGGAFYSCDYITSVNLPASLEYIEGWAFGDCQLLEAINVDSENTTYKSVDGVLFTYNLDSVIAYPSGKKGEFHIGEDFDSDINSSVFHQINTDKFVVDSENKKYCSVDGVIYSKDKTELIVAPRNITSIVAPSELTSIRQNSLEQLYNLESIDLSSTKITNLPYRCFADDNKLNSVVLPNTLETIDGYSFNYCTSLKTIELPSSLIRISYYAFMYCSALEALEIPSSVTEIQYYAFYYCTSLKNMVIPDTVTNLGTNGLFSECSSLESVTLPKSLSGNLSSSLFYNCSSLKSFNIPSGINCIDYSAFYNCSSLESIELPSNLTNIGQQAFRGCSSLESIELPNSLIWVESWAFADCTSLESITFPSSLQNIYDSVFYNCTSLKTVYYPSTNINSYSTSQLFYNCTSLESVTLPNNIPWLGWGMFYNCEKLKTIDIPSNVSNIESCVFYGCKSLETIDIPSSVSSIGSSAFQNCTSLTSIYIPSTVTNLNTENLFYNCTSLVIVDIESTISEVGNGMFYNCTSLSSITFLGTITRFGFQSFYNCSSFENYSITSSVTYIDSEAFSGVKSIIIPASITFSFNDNSFQDCTIYYEGSTISEWKQTGIVLYKKVYLYSETEPTDSGDYWHYDNSGSPIIWETQQA